jgi:hypothetical protein
VADLLRHLKMMLQHRQVFLGDAFSVGSWPELASFWKSAMSS